MVQRVQLPGAAQDVPGQPTRFTDAYHVHGGFYGSRVKLVVHIYSQVFSHSLFELAMRPEYIEPLRKEVENSIRMYGWTKEAIGQMKKLDSFLREDQRLYGIITAGQSLFQSRRNLNLNCDE